MFKGSLVALVTPFDSLGKVDFSALEKLIEWQIEEGTDGLILCGTTGEGSTLSEEEKIAIFRFAVEVGGGRIPIIASTGSNQTGESVSLTQEAKKGGVDGCIAIVPYCNRPTEEGCFAHFSAIAKVGLPLILYHHPGRTGVKLSAEGLARMSEIPQVVGIKESSGDLSLALEILSLSQTSLFCGDDILALAHFAIGFTGSISIIGNVVPQEWKTFISTALSGDFPQARLLFQELYPLCKALVLETNPQCVKFALGLQERCLGSLRLPLLEPREENQKKIKEALLTAGLV